MNLYKIYTDIIKESISDVETSVYSPDNYIDTYIENIDNNKQKGLQYIQNIINDFKKINFPLTIYKGLNITQPNKTIKLSDLNNNINSFWSNNIYATKKNNNNIIFVAEVNSLDDVDIEMSIDSRIINRDKSEIVASNPKIIGYKRLEDIKVKII